MTIKRIKELLKVESHFQLIVVLTVFSITGSLALVVSDYFLNILNINKINYNAVIYYILRILFIFPVYQFLLIIIGTIFGEFKYFWNFEKKFLKKLGFKFK